MGRIDCAKHYEYISDDLTYFVFTDARGLGILSLGKNFKYPACVVMLEDSQNYYYWIKLSACKNLTSVTSDLEYCGTIIHFNMSNMYIGRL